MDFKIGEVEDQSSTSVETKRTQLNKKMSLIIIIAAALICGLLFFFVSNALFGKKTTKEEPRTEVSLDLNDENVKILYSYVTYGTGKRRNDKFIKEKQVTLGTFTDEEKLYYALQFVKAKDLLFTGEYNDDHKKIYNLSDETIRNYMQRFFGESPFYTALEKYTYRFKNVSYGGQSVATLTPSTKAAGGYDLVFDGEEVEEKDELMDPFYASLVAAYQEANGAYRLEEKIVYTQLVKNGSSYNVYIYRDFEKTQLIEAKTNQTEDMILANPVSIKDYLEDASTITYHFGLFNNTLYFESSEIETA